MIGTIDHVNEIVKLEQRRQERQLWSAPDLRKLLKGTGWTYVGQGSYRRAYRYDDVVYKLGTYTSMDFMQRRELAMFTALAHHPWIPPATGWEHRMGPVVALPYYETWPDGYSSMLSQLTTANRVFSDLNADNVRMDGGQVVVIDGGNVRSPYDRVTTPHEAQAALKRAAPDLLLTPAVA